jgi:hypothetical protein
VRATTPERTSEREAGQNTWKKKQVVTTEHEYKLALPRKAFHLHLANKRLFSIFHIIGISVPNLIIVILIQIEIVNTDNHNASFAPKSGWGMLVYAPGWILVSQF